MGRNSIDAASGRGLGSRGTCEPWTIPAVLPSVLLRLSRSLFQQYTTLSSIITLYP